MAIKLEINRAVYTTTIAKTKTFEIDITKMPVEAVEKFIAYGVQRVFNDAVGGADKDAKTKVELAEKMIADYAKGEIGRQSTGGVDPLVKMCRTIAREQLRAAYAKRADLKYSDFTALTADEQNAKLDAIIEANRKVIEAAAKERMEAKASLTVDVDL